MSDRQRNPASGLNIRFYGRAGRAAGVDESVLSAPFDRATVEKCLLAMPQEGHDAWFSNFQGRTPDEFFMFQTAAPMRLIALEHVFCEECDVADWVDPDAEMQNHEQFLDHYPELDDHVEILAGILSTRTELFFDFLCALIQGHDIRDRSASLGYPPGTYDNRAVRNDIETAVNDQLAASGWYLSEGFPIRLDGSSKLESGPTTWKEVHAKLAEADREMVQQRWSDAITDIGTALQLALTAAGHRGKVLSEQIKSARANGLLDGTHARLGEAVLALGNWAAGVRNGLSDSHPGTREAGRDDAVLTRAVVGAVTTYLYEQRPHGPK